VVSIPVLALSHFRKRISEKMLYIVAYSRSMGMTKVITGHLKQKGRKIPPTGSISMKRVIGPDGRPRNVWTLNAHSLSFGHDLQYVFRKNVSKARRANKRILGSTDLATRKP
jgi:hypothetical protein